MAEVKLPLCSVVIMAEAEHLRKLAQDWKTELLEQVIPFWMKYRFAMDNGYRRQLLQRLKLYVSMSDLLHL